MDIESHRDLKLLEAVDADSRVTHVQDSQRVTHICARPQFAEPWAGRGHFSD